MSETKQKRSRKNPMTPILRDLRVAVTRIEKVRDGLKKLDLLGAHEIASELVDEVDGLVENIGHAWGDAASKRARQDVLNAYSHPTDQPLPSVNMEA